MGKLFPFKLFNVWSLNERVAPRIFAAKEERSIEYRITKTLLQSGCPRHLALTCFDTLEVLWFLAALDTSWPRVALRLAALTPTRSAASAILKRKKNVGWQKKNEVVIKGMLREEMQRNEGSTRIFVEEGKLRKLTGKKVKWLWKGRFHFFDFIEIDR